MSKPGEGPAPEPQAAPRAQSPLGAPLDAMRALVGLTDRAPLELRLLGRTLLHACAVGVVAGLAGAAFFAGLELGQRLLLERAAGFPLLRAQGEALGATGPTVSLRPWLLAMLPALGGLASGLLSYWLAPETAGGGGNAAVDAYHRGGVVRRRVAPVKAIASILALSSGGSGGREGPTMQIGASLGAAVGRWLPTSARERRVLVIAGIAAGIAAVFRTPLGAALLATEMLYRDDFEADALVPSIFASVVAYSIVIAIFGETTVFGTLPRFPFTPAHLPLYAALAIAISFVAIAFARTLRGVEHLAARSRLPAWLRPAVGGLLMGVLGTALALYMERNHGPAARSFGVFGGGYGVLAAAMAGAGWLGAGWTVAGLFAAVAVAKLVASALTIGSGAAAGDFAPSLVVGGLVGAAFGVGARLVLADPTIQPAAFALVGMGTFYGGLAHAPLSALVLVAELAGSYDLLVPMMLAIGIAYVALRRDTLYPAQPRTRAQSPVHRARGGDAAALERVARRRARDLLVRSELDPFDAHASLDDVVAAADRARRQRVAVVRGAHGHAGLLELAVISDLPREDRRWLRAQDAIVPFVSVAEDAAWAEAALALERSGLSQIPVLGNGEVVGWIGDRELRRAVVDAVGASDVP